MNHILRGKITKGGSYQIDETLTIEGVGADAKATGDAIKEAEERVNEEINAHKIDSDNPHKVTASQVGARPDSWTPTAQEVGARPDTWMPTASDVGARPDTWTPTAQEVGARPSNWTPTPEEVGARPNTWLPTPSEIGAATAFELTATIPVSRWFAIANSAYENDLDVAGVLGSDKVEVDVRMDDTSWEGIASNMQIEEEFAKIYHIPVSDGRLYIRAKELPTVDIPIKIKVVR